MVESGPPDCPHCGKKLSSTVWAKALDQHRMVLSLTPAAGDRLSARSVGGSLASLEKLLRAVGRDLGVKTIPMVERVETTETGEIRFHLLIANAASGKSLPAVAKHLRDRRTAEQVPPPPEENG